MVLPIRKRVEGSPINNFSRLVDLLKHRKDEDKLTSTVGTC